MKLVSPLLKKIVYPALQHTGGMRYIAPASGCAVVNYHGVLPEDYRSADAFLDGNLVSAGTLRRQLRYLKTHYEVIRPEEFRGSIESGKALPARSVLVTCDDGLLNHLTEMVSILREEGIYCLFFVTGKSCSGRPSLLWYEELYLLLRAGKLDEADLRRVFQDSRNHSGASLPTLWWEAVRGASRLNYEDRAALLETWRSRGHSAEYELSEKRWRLLNADELRELSRAGMTIGAHTMSHPVLAQCGDTESYHEIHESKVQLERVLGQPVWAFAYPFGNPSTVGDREVRFAEEAGFECAFLNTDGGVADRSHRFSISRTHITSEMSIAELEAHMSGLHARLQRAVRG